MIEPPETEQTGIRVFELQSEPSFDSSWLTLELNLNDFLAICHISGLEFIFHYGTEFFWLEREIRAIIKTRAEEVK